VDVKSSKKLRKAFVNGSGAPMSACFISLAFFGGKFGEPSHLRLSSH
jgi:hypothetical protein